MKANIKHHDMHDAIATNRRERKVASEDIRALIAGLGEGDQVEIPLPDGQPRRRMSYQFVNSMAWHIFGPREYTLKTTDAGMIVKRPWKAGPRA